MRLTQRIKRQEARSFPGIPAAAMVIEPRPGEGNAEAKARHLAMHPEQLGAPTIFLRLTHDN